MLRRHSYAYDAAGQQVLRIDARGYRTSYVYDAASQLLERRYPDGSRASFAYDPVGNRTLAANETGRYTTSYDLLGRTLAAASPPDNVITYAYDAVGQRRFMIEPGGGRFSYQYDPRRQITWLLNPFQERTTFAYDPAGRRTVKRLANGTRASFTYDPAGNITLLANLRSDGTTLSSFAYAYDPAGNRTHVVEADGVRVSWSYDPIYQLTRAQRSGSLAYDTTYTYDPVGNRLRVLEDGARTTYTYDAADQLVTRVDSSGVTSYTFDANGNQQVTAEPNGERTTNTWDYENRRMVAEVPNDGRTTAAYDTEGLRVELVKSDGPKQFIWDEERWLSEVEDGDEQARLYTVEPTVYGRLVAQTQAGVSHHYLFDAIGTTTALLDTAQAVFGSYAFDSWGRPLAIATPLATSALFVGELGYITDSSAGQAIASYLARRRFYDPYKGRFDSPDPLISRGLSFARAARAIPILGAAAGWSLYEYARNSPLDHVDPSGLQARPIFGSPEENSPWEVIRERRRGPIDSLRYPCAHLPDIKAEPGSGSSCSRTSVADTGWILYEAIPIETKGKASGGILNEASMVSCVAVKVFYACYCCDRACLPPGFKVEERSKVARYERTRYGYTVEDTIGKALLVRAGTLSLEPQWYEMFRERFNRKAKEENRKRDPDDHVPEIPELAAKFIWWANEEEHVRARRECVKRLRSAKSLTEYGDDPPPARLQCAPVPP